MENASWVMVLVPILYNNIRPNTLNHISISAGETPIIRTKPRICVVRFSPEETPTIRTEPRNCAVIFSPGGNTAQLHSVAVAGLREPPK